MSFLDIILGTLLCYAGYNGLKKGLFVELASLIALIVGIFVAIKFSYLLQTVISNHVSWSPKIIKITAFGITFSLVVMGIHTLAKVFTSIASFAYLGFINRLGGMIFSILKTVLALSVMINLFLKININNIIVEKETLDQSVFFNPIQEIAALVYPSLKTIYDEQISKVNASE